MNIRTHMSRVEVMATILLLASCARATEGEVSNKGTITISGAWALYPMVVQWAEAYQEIHPGIEFDISAGGAGKGMADALAGVVDIGMVSREIHPEELKRGAFWISVTKDAVFLTVNQQNPVWRELSEQGVSRETLIGIFITGEITTWGQVVDRADIADPIHIFTRSDSCGAAATWAEYLGGVQEDLLGIGVYGDPGVMEAVINDPLGIGYNNLNFAYDFDTSLPVLGAMIAPIDINHNGAADPEETYQTKDEAIAAVASGQYPSPPARALNLVTLGKPAGPAQLFIHWVLTDGQQYVADTGYIALPEEALAAEVEKLK